MNETEPIRTEAECVEAEQRILDGLIIALAEHDTETLRAVADYRDTIRADGWLQQMIREYVDVWR